MRKYTHQVILNLRKDENYKQNLLDTKNYVNSKAINSNVSVIDFENNEKPLKKLSQLNQNSRLYVLAHDIRFDPKEGPQISQKEDVSNDETSLWSSHQLANLLAKNLSHLKSDHNTQDLLSDRLVISLVVCYGASHLCNQTIIDSFAGQLQDKLAQQKIFVNIEARTGIVAIDPSEKNKKTIPQDKENKYLQLKQLQNHLHEHQSPLYNFSVLEENNLFEHQSPNSKISILWKKGQQVAYEAYEFKQHKTQYQRIKKAVNELREYAGRRKNKADYSDVVATAYNLANDIEKEANQFFNGTNKHKQATEQFKQNCKKHFEKAQTLLATHRDSDLKRGVGKLALGLTSIVGLSVPYFIHEGLIKEGYFSTGLFSDKTGGQIVADNLSEAIDDTTPVSKFK